ncbi:hypothetical protein [Methanobrevibacter sp.]|uniref:hypothetical protein n=1 Tax=Methanobrevibacter sp. TaxID=66852 RepID=UPI0038906896
MDGVYGHILALILEVIIFFILVAIGTVIYKWVRVSIDKRLAKGDLLPEDEIHTLKQVFYLIIMSLAFVNILYSIINGITLIYFVIFDIVLSVFLAVALDKSSTKGKLLLLLLVPFYSLNMLMFNFTLVSYVNLIHVLVFAYFVKLYYDKFREYTESNSLGVTILILYVVVFVSFILTQIVEGVNPLDSLVMVSNAFTSNGYAILGSTIGGKLNAIVLVWAGYILSGVGTATLAATILMKHFNHKFRDVEESNKELKESINELKESNRKLEELIKNNGNSNEDS